MMVGLQLSIIKLIEEFGERRLFGNYLYEIQLLYNVAFVYVYLQAEVVFLQFIE